MKILFVFMVLFAFPVVASEYKIDYTRSVISFLGTHADKQFEGKFELWQGDIVFDSAHLDESHVKFVFDLSRAKTGNAMFDGTLPQSDWFDIKNTPEGVFESTEITKNEDGSYAMQGNLSLRGIVKPVHFDFKLIDGGESLVAAQGVIAINRLDYDIGRKSDAPAEWVGRDIAVVFLIQASVLEPSL